jgi:hypothetical protein
VATLAAVLAACARLRPPEPTLAPELWKEKRCFAHMLPQWRHQRLRALSGKVWAGGTGQNEVVPDAVVYVRAWPVGAIHETRTDAAGNFGFPGIGGGIFEVAVCRDGWNPWRGTVEVSGWAVRARGTFVIDLGV